MATVSVRGRSFTCGQQTSVLESMRRQGVSAIKVGCRNGGCGVCKVRVRSGDYRCGKMSRAHVSKHEESEGWALACRTYANGDLELELPEPD